MSSPSRKRTHSLTKDTNSSHISSPRKKTKESLTTPTPKNVNTPNYNLRSKNKQVRSTIGIDTGDKFENSKKKVNYIGNNSSSKIDNDSYELSGGLTRNTSSLSIEDNYNNNIGSNESSPLSSPPSSPSSESDTENDNDVKDDTIEPLLLPNVVWVNDEKRGWWPSEIISKDKSEKPLLVRYFGQEQPDRPCTLELHNISKSNILPFDESLIQLRNIDKNSALFKQAINEARVKETEDNDGLPSKDFAFQMAVDSSPNKKKSLIVNETHMKGKYHPSELGKESSNKEKFTTKQEFNNFSEFDFEKDETLQIPGEYVFSLSSKIMNYRKKYYYPAKIIDYNESDKYKVLFCDNSSEIVKRKDFFTMFEDGFKTCELGQFEMNFEDPTYEEPELVMKIQSLESILSRILRGEESSWRFQYFCQGGKKLKLLASRVSPGPFNLNQFELIAKVLRRIFIPEIAESIDRKNKVFLPLKLANIDDENNSISNIKDHEETRSSEDNKFVNIDESQQKKQNFDFQDLSSDLKLRFVNDVLLPETIIRLVMNEEKMEYEEAERKVLNGYNETSWVEHLMAERASFQIGSESLKERIEYNS